MADVIVKAGERMKFFEFLKFRELIYFMTWREFKVRYKQTFLGVIWAILQPLMFAGIISLVLTKRAGLSFGYENVNDVVVIFFGFSFWQYFQGSLAGSITAIGNNKSLIVKNYFPKIILIFSLLTSRIVDLLLQTGVFILLVLFTGGSINFLGLLFIPLFIFTLASVCLGVGLILGPLNVKFKDIQMALPFFIRIMFFTTPIWYPFSIIPEEIQKFLLLNPIVAVLELARDIIFGGVYNFSLLVYPVITIFILFAIGIPVFKRFEGKIADYM